MHNLSDLSFLHNRAIFAPKNLIVDLIPGEEKTYLSYDFPYNARSDVYMSDNMHTPEFLNIIVSSRLPNHKLSLKVGVWIMLLRNIDPFLGLCNDTRLIITKMGRYVLEGKIILVRKILFQGYH